MYCKRKPQRSLAFQKRCANEQAWAVQVVKAQLPDAGCGTEVTNALHAFIPFIDDVVAKSHIFWATAGGRAKKRRYSVFLAKLNHFAFAQINTAYYFLTFHSSNNFRKKWHFHEFAFQFCSWGQVSQAKNCSSKEIKKEENKLKPNVHCVKVLGLSTIQCPRCATNCTDFDFSIF